MSSSEEQLIRLRRRFDSLFETATAGILVQAPDGRILHTNLLAASIFGVPLEELRRLAGTPGRRLRWFAEDGSEIPPEERPIQKARSTLLPVRGARCGLEIGSRRLWLRIDCIPVLGEVGELEELVTYFVNESELRERALREAEELRHKELADAAHLAESREQARTFRGLYELALAATGVLDSAALATLATATAVTLVGGRSSALLWYDAEHGLLRALADSSPGPVAAPVRPGEGAAGRAYTSGRPVVATPRTEPDSEPAQPGDCCSGLVVAVPATVGDLTVGALMVRFQAEKRVSDSDLDLLGLIASLVAPALESARLHAALRESELRQSALVEAALDCIIATDAAGIVTEFNPAAEKTFGYRAQEVLGRPLADLVEGGDAQLLKEEGPMPLVGHRNEGQGVRQDGSRFPIEMVVIGLAHSARPLILVSVRDLTPIHQAETARRESEAKSRFLATMSHELRTPLNSVLGFAQLLEAEQFGPLNDRQRRYLRNIAGSGQHLLGLINDVLDLSKVQAGEMELVLEPVDLDGVLAESVEQMLPQARAKNIRLENEPAIGLRLAGDRRRVFQIMLNLISNALKFTSEGGAVTVGSSCRGGRVLVTVRDNGVGIPKHLLGRVFEEFTQVESGTTRNQEGTGLGLALSRRLAELMGGSLEVESEPGRGSTFTLELPLLIGARI